MVKPEWGTKRSCPKCNTRFYDLTNSDPIVCIACGYSWIAEEILKSKQTVPFGESRSPHELREVDTDLDPDEDIDIDEDTAIDEDVDLGNDDDDLETVVGNKDLSEEES